MEAVGRIGRLAQVRELESQAEIQEKTGPKKAVRQKVGRSPNSGKSGRFELLLRL